MSKLSLFNLRISNLQLQWRVQYRLLSTQPNVSCNKADVKQSEGEDDFRVLDIGLGAVKNFLNNRRRIQRRSVVPPPRADTMPVDQDWPTVWPTARVFHPATVPLPLHQGWVPPGQAPPDKFANAELMKIPNFLHLTPPAIQRHCETLKKFCTPWPKELTTEEDMDRHFPIRFVSSDFCHSSPTIRDPRSRIVTLRVKLDSLPLDTHAKDKLLRLLKEKYDQETDIISLVAERCPLKKQNKDYAVYLLNVLVSESWKVEAWEKEKSQSDMEMYVWEDSPSHSSIQQQLKGSAKPELLEEYKEAVTQLHNQGEDPDTIARYKSSVKALVMGK